ncbi:MAG TPA: hypothetical protein VG274_01050 [Rhizomicrobium sp.]|nr:hypothetical protein [Rhizomicrobium sp.]
MSPRILRRWSFATLACIGSLTPAAATTPTLRGGVYVIVDATAQDQYAVVTQALQTPGVDGLLIHLRWGQISTKLKTYDWTNLDQAIQLAMTANKRFEIGIVTGGAMPQWISDPPPMGLGARHATFEVDAAGTCATFDTAPPYDPAYLAAFRDMLAQLAQHLRSTHTYDHLAMLKLFGITTTTDELRLPATTAKCGDNVATWQSLSYRPAKMERGWKAMLKAYLHHFPEKSFNIGFIGINAFPGIRDDGSAAATSQEAENLSEALAAKLIADAGAARPGHVALGFDSLTLNLPPDDKSYPKSRREFFSDAADANARLGWQTNELLGDYPGGGASCGGSDPSNAVACTDWQEFRQMLFRGLYPHGKTNMPPSMQGVYLEMFPQNVAAFPQAVPPAHKNLGVWNGEQSRAPQEAGGNRASSTPFSR